MITQSIKSRFPTRGDAKQILTCLRKSLLPKGILHRMKQFLKEKSLGDTEKEQKNQLALILETTDYVVTVENEKFSIWPSDEALDFWQQIDSSASAFLSMMKNEELPDEKNEELLEENAEDWPAAEVTAICSQAAVKAEYGNVQFNDSNMDMFEQASNQFDFDNDMDQPINHEPILICSGGNPMDNIESAAVKSSDNNDDVTSLSNTIEERLDNDVSIVNAKFSIKMIQGIVQDLLACEYLNIKLTDKVALLYADFTENVQLGPVFRIMANRSGMALFFCHTIDIGAIHRKINEDKCKFYILSYCKEPYRREICKILP